MREDLVQKLAAAREAAARAAEEKAERTEEEQNEAEQSKLQSFASLITTRNRLGEIGGEIETAKESLSAARSGRHEVMRENNTAITEMRQLYQETLDGVGGDENHPVVQEVKSLLDGVGPTDGEPFQAATESGQAAIETLRNLKSELAEAGIETEGKGIDELVGEISARKQAVDAEMVAFVRQNPELQSEEIDKIKQEIIEKEASAVTSRIHHDSFAGVLGSAEKNLNERFFEDFKINKSNTDPEYFNRVGKIVTDRLLDSFTADKSEFAKFLKVIAEHTEGDQLSKVAVTEAIKQQLVKYNPIYTGENKQILRVLKEVAETDGLEIPKFEDGPGIPKEAYPLLAEVLDQSQIEALSEKVLEAAKIEKDLVNLPELEWELKAAEQAIKEKTHQLEQLNRSDNGLEIVRLRDSVEKMERSLSGLQSLLEGDAEALGEPLSISSSYGEVRVTSEYFAQKQKSSNEGIIRLRKSLEEALDSAQRAYSDARKATRAKASFIKFNKGKLEAAEAEAKLTYEAAEKAVNEITNNPDFITLDTQNRSDSQAYKEFTRPIEEQIRSLPINLDKVTAVNAAELLQAITEKVQASKNNYNNSIVEYESRLAQEAAKRAELETEVERLEQILEPVNVSHRTISEYIQERERQLQQAKDQIFSKQQQTRY